MRYDAAIVGGGLVGAACADALAREGLSVCLLEAGPFVREASWAAAGILHPIHPWRYPAPLHPLLRGALAEHERCAARLLEETGVDVELERSGLLVLGPAIERLAEWSSDRPWRRVEAASEEPSLRAPGPALLLPDACHVRSHRLARALLMSARLRGADLREFTRVAALRPGAVLTERERIQAGTTVLCAGAWAARLVPGLEVEPVRGQILLYRGTARRMVVFPEDEYVVPRRGGLLLFGSTLERAGFDARPTEETVAALGQRAERLFGLKLQDCVAAWAGLRPATPHLLPYLGRHPERPDLILACGHFRNGILLGPLTARIVADLVVGRDPGLALGPFRKP